MQAGERCASNVNAVFLNAVCTQQPMRRIFTRRFTWVQQDHAQPAVLPSLIHDDQHDVAGGAARGGRHDLHVALGCLLQRQLHAHHRRQAAGLHRLVQPGVGRPHLLRRRVAREHAPDVQLQRHRRARVEADLGGTAADDANAAVARHYAHVCRQVGARHHLEAHIEAGAAGGSRLGRREVALLTVVESCIGAGSLDGLQARLRAGSPDHNTPSAQRKLHRRQAHRAARAMHQHRLARLDVAALEERAVRGAGGDAQAGALGEGDALREREGLRLGAEGVLRVGARQAAVQIHTVAHGEPAAIAHSLHHAGAVLARSEGRGWQDGHPRVRARGAQPDIGVAGVHARRPNAHAQLPRPGRGQRLGRHLQHLRPAEVLTHDGTEVQLTRHCGSVAGG
mmetsp:Transcript_45879/g.117339  ORF Transcript_45879/g.117339 Transcript_45879/m.117339 type:complete len:395 (+) Transcript_45879:351-1535(+)